MLEDVNDAIGDLVEIIKTYKGKNKISQVLMSSLFKQRQDEAEAIIDRAISRLHVRNLVHVCLVFVAAAAAAAANTTNESVFFSRAPCFVCTVILNYLPYYHTSILL